MASEAAGKAIDNLHDNIEPLSFFPLQGAGTEGTSILQNTASKKQMMKTQQQTRQ
ncbi:MAG: hypothetical protein IJ745_05080 [Bacteroidales bacterium]|nr:hypothetical protein [Bacteroidales bacterium]